ncbi:MAG: acetate--CoA ligase family protein [Pigmentiphaga sp.]|uniref:acetate--CoA ligase family protein n=1 Tax=Pigmentiphaga sp. TaxID=1977564 RepID=UPI0029B7920F|nr:acetate--CoA ligase family protein [Pigmentiphaga sp.]MDX3905213.1 acetate--CoA ligase family protein [Pigmentiphaga sp.]
MSSIDLDRLLRPQSIAVVGASPEPASVSGLLLANLRRFGYAGKLHLVSRSRDEVDGIPCVKTIDDLPEGVDVAVLVVPQAAVCEAVAACGRRRVGAAVVFASGFAELGDDGRASQDELARIARQGGVAVLGPNCLGFINFADGVPLTFEPVQPVSVGHGPRIGIVAQSGAMSGNLRQAFHGKGLGVSFSVSTGNEAVLSTEDFLAALVEAPDVDALAVFVEMLRKPAAFLRVAARARELGKPLVLMHPGRSQRAREAAKSHTGALAGDYQTMRTLAEREGVVVVDTMDELFDVTAILARYPAPVAQGKAAVASNSGALRGVALDFCEDIGLELAEFAPATMQALSEILPDFMAPDNPLDLTAIGMQKPEIFGQSARAILDDPDVGSLVMPLMGGSPAQQLAKAESLLPVMQTSSKPVCFVMMGDSGPLGEEFLARVKESGMPFLRSPDRALRAMAHVHRYGRLRAAAGDRSAGRGARIPELRPGPLAEYKGKQWLRDLGIGTPSGGLARTREEALEIAGRIGYPVVLKAQADALMHKSDAGGVAIGLADAQALEAAWQRIEAAIGRYRPGLVLDGMLVEAMSAPGLELVIGCRRDPNWGVVALVGLGGIWIEALQDVRLLAPDLTEAQIVRELGKLKGARLLSGLRGRPAVDVAAVAAAVRKLADLVLANPEIVEVDVNPLIALPAGEGIVALDALFVMAGQEAAHNAGIRS